MLCIILFVIEKFLLIVPLLWLVLCYTKLQSNLSYSGHTEAVLSVSFSPDGQNLASGSGDTTVRLWDLNTQTPLFTCSGEFKKLPIPHSIFLHDSSLHISIPFPSTFVL